MTTRPSPKTWNFAFYMWWLQPKLAWLCVDLVSRSESSSIRFHRLAMVFPVNQCWHCIREVMQAMFLPQVLTPRPTTISVDRKWTGRQRPFMSTGNEWLTQMSYEDRSQALKALKDMAEVDEMYGIIVLIRWLISLLWACAQWFVHPAFSTNSWCQND